MKSPVILAAAMMFSSAFAADIALVDGRTFKDASISSQTPLKVVIKHAGGLTSVSKQQLPADLLARYPIDEAGARAAEEKSALAREAAAKSRQAEAERFAKIRANREASAASKAIADEKSAVAQKNDLAYARRGAQSALEKYFGETYSWSPGTERIVEVTINDIRETPGWSDRWSVTGHAIVRNYLHSSKPVNTEGMSAKEATRAEYRAAKYTVETREFQADYSPDSGTPLNVTLR
ncbi:MAG: hypothetical protein QM760_18470 [Nibricoccus sp.]